MTPDQRSVLRATPGSRSGSMQRRADIATASGLDCLTIVGPALDLLAGMGLVETRRVPRDLLYCRTPEGDRQAGGGR